MNDYEITPWFLNDPSAMGKCLASRFWGICCLPSQESRWHVDHLSRFPNATNVWSETSRWWSIYIYIVCIYIYIVYIYIYIYIYILYTYIYIYMSDCENPRFTERTSTNLGRSHRLPHVCTIMIYGKLGGYRLQENAAFIYYIYIYVMNYE